MTDTYTPDGKPVFEPEEAELILRVYLAPSGQWAGKLLSGDVEIGGVAGCASAEAVEEAAAESGIYPDRVEIVTASGQLPS